MEDNLCIERDDRMRSKIVLAGGTGFIGRYLEQEFRKQGYEVILISRSSEHIQWHDTERMKAALNDAEILINLAGKSVDCRYNAKNRAEIFRSRTETTRTLGECVQACSHPPKLWLNSSTATIYRHAEDRPMTEQAGEIGSGFSVDVATEWEKAFFSFKLSQTRQVALRIAIVLGKNGGVMTPYRNLVRFGLGGPQGPGNQRFSWIHVEDLYRIILFLRDHEEISGVINCAAPNPVLNRELMQLLRKTMSRKLGLPAPRWLLEIGARLIQTETELIMKSRWVIPERLEQAGYAFKYGKLDQALNHILRE